MIINENINTMTDEKKLEMISKRIGKKFISIKQAVNSFDEEVNNIVFDNKLGFTSTQIIEAFTTKYNTTATELNSIKNNLKAEADNIENQ